VQHVHTYDRRFSPLLAARKFKHSREFERQREELIGRSLYLYLSATKLILVPRLGVRRDVE
jgi:hypothetical protein